MTNRTIDGGLSANPERGIVKADHPMLVGHFPGHPIVPGAWLLAWVVAAAMRRLSATGESCSIAAIKRVKFLRPLAPDHAFECTLDLRASAEGVQAGRNDTMRFAVTSGGGVIAEGSLLLQQRAIEPAQ
jgi:3-hydroxymyristoyl/3-hydroxydecanoyl-(acyl carrier protein) dehydratase